MRSRYSHQAGYFGNLQVALFYCFILLCLAMPQAGFSRPNSHPSPTPEVEETVQLVDVPSVSIENPKAAVKLIPTTKPVLRLDCDILIAGGGLGGLAAALKIYDLSHSALLPKSSPVKVLLTEESNWLGGQITSQGVSAFDENHLVESSGACRKYQDLRKAISDFYRNNHKLSSDAQNDAYLNPGSCWVSKLAFEPKVALSVIDQFTQPAMEDSSLKILYRHKIFKAISTRRRKQSEPVSSNFVREYWATNLDTGKTVRIRAKICLDATELGDILPLAHLDYSSGSESQAQTGEPHAAPKEDPDNVQDFTYPFIVEFRDAEAHRIDKSPHYDEFEERQKFSLDGYRMFRLGAKNQRNDGTDHSAFWEYRRLIDASNFSGPDFPYDLSMINWESNDLRGFNIIDKPAVVQAERLALAKSLSLGFLYWLQNKAPRDEGGYGYPELLLRKDMLGSKDGLSQYPYIREARRAKTCQTIVEQDIVRAWTAGARARTYQDSVGIGSYPVDIHGHQDVAGTCQSTRPFEIPLGALVPSILTNVLPACKNIGTTHVTNGAYRLHPIEWAIGEAQGTLALFALKHKVRPMEAFGQLSMVRSLQQLLIESGTPIYWYSDVPTNHPQFKAIQYLAATDIFKGNPNSLHFEPDRPITRAEAAVAFAQLLFPSPLSRRENQFADKVTDLAGFEYAKPAVEACLSKLVMMADANNNFRPSEALASNELEWAAQYKPIEKISNIHSFVPQFAPTTTITRSQFAAWLYEIATSKRYTGRR